MRRKRAVLRERIFFSNVLQMSYARVMEAAETEPRKGENRQRDRGRVVARIQERAIAQSRQPGAYFMGNAFHHRTFILFS